MTYNCPYLLSDEGSYRRIASQGEFSSSSEESSKLYNSPIGGSGANANGGSSSAVPDVLVYNPSIPKNTPNHVLESQIKAKYSSNFNTLILSYVMKPCVRIVCALIKNNHLFYS